MVFDFYHRYLLLTNKILLLLSFRNNFVLKLRSHCDNPVGKYDVTCDNECVICQICILFISTLCSDDKNNNNSKSSSNNMADRK